MGAAMPPNHTCKPLPKERKKVFTICASPQFGLHPAHVSQDKHLTQTHLMKLKSTSIIRAAFAAVFIAAHDVEMAVAVEIGQTVIPARG